MAHQYLIFRLVEGAGSRHQRVYLLPGGKWGRAQAKALRGSLQKMRALANSIQGAYPYLIIERLDAAGEAKTGSAKSTRSGTGLGASPG